MRIILTLGCGKEAPGHLERECRSRPMTRHVSAPPEEPARRVGVVVDNVFLEGIINEAKERKEKERQTKAVPIPPPRSANPEPPASPIAGPLRPCPDTPVVFRKVDPDWTPDSTQWTWDSSWPRQKHLSGEEWRNVGRNARNEWFDKEEDDGTDWELYGDGEQCKDDKKPLCQLLGKLYILNEVDDDQLRTLKLLMESPRSRRSIRDTTAQNSFIKSDDVLSKKFAKQLEGVSEEEYRQLENMKDLFEFLHAVQPDSEEKDVKSAKRIRKRYNLNAAVALSTLTSYQGDPKCLLSQSDEESEAESVEAVPRWVMLKRFAASIFKQCGEDEPELYYIIFPVSHSGDKADDDPRCERPAIVAGVVVIVVIGRGLHELNAAIERSTKQKSRKLLPLTALSVVYKSSLPWLLFPFTCPFIRLLNMFITTAPKQETSPELAPPPPPLPNPSTGSANPAASLPALWGYLQPALNHIVRSPTNNTNKPPAIDVSYHMGMHTAVPNKPPRDLPLVYVQMPQRRPKPATDLYEQINSFYADAARDLFLGASTDDTTLVHYLVTCFNHYAAGAQSVSRLLNYVNRHYVKCAIDEDRGWLRLADMLDAVARTIQEDDTRDKIQKRLRERRTEEPGSCLTCRPPALIVQTAKSDHHRGTRT
ncbi:predicted protein [Postia placenta Mad-698-R]|nr:predicted protein [Postia placenta Mad-698-R]